MDWKLFLVSFLERKLELLAPVSEVVVFVAVAESVTGTAPVVPEQPAAVEQLVVAALEPWLVSESAVVEPSQLEPAAFAPVAVVESVIVVVAVPAAVAAESVEISADSAFAAAAETATAEVVVAAAEAAGAAIAEASISAVIPPTGLVIFLFSAAVVSTIPPALSG